MAKAQKTPWKRPNPRKRAGKASKHLSPAKKSAAKARAKRAGRPYPNLVDNMRMAAKKTKKSAKKAGKKTAKKAKKKSSAKEGQEARGFEREEIRAQTKRERPAGRSHRCGPQGLRAPRWLALETGGHPQSIGHVAVGYAAQGELGGAVLWPRQATASGRCQGQADATRAVGACLGRTGAEDRGGGAAHRGQGRASTAALSPDPGESITLKTAWSATARLIGRTSWGRLGVAARKV